MNSYQFLKKSVKGVALKTLLPSRAFFTANEKQKVVHGNYCVNESFEPDTDIELTAILFELLLFLRNKTNILSYQLKLISGDKATHEKLSGCLVTEKK